MAPWGPRAAETSATLAEGDKLFLFAVYNDQSGNLTAYMPVYKDVSDASEFDSLNSITALTAGPLVGKATAVVLYLGRTSTLAAFQLVMPRYLSAFTRRQTRKIIRRRVTLFALLALGQRRCRSVQGSRPTSVTISRQITPKTWRLCVSAAYKPPPLVLTSAVYLRRRHKSRLAKPLLPRRSGWASWSMDGWINNGRARHAAGGRHNLWRAPKDRLWRTTSRHAHGSGRARRKIQNPRSDGQDTRGMESLQRAFAHDADCESGAKGAM
jgi:hypothetical protein